MEWLRKRILHCLEAELSRREAELWRSAMVDRVSCLAVRVAHLEPIEPHFDTCACCGCPKRFEFSVKNELWSLVPEPWQDTILCLECFLSKLDGRGEQLSIGLDDFTHMSIGGANLDGLLVHMSPSGKESGELGLRRRKPRIGRCAESHKGL